MGGHDEGPALAGGVRVFSIGGRMVEQRERCLGMTNEERRWRAQYLKDQALAANEPRFVPELYKATNNIFVRMTRIPLNLVEKAVTPILGEKRAPTFRYITGRILGIYLGALCITYYFKYNTQVDPWLANLLVVPYDKLAFLYNFQDWTTCGGWYTMESRDRKLPGDEGYPKIDYKEKHEYLDLGFSKSPFA